MHRYSCFERLLFPPTFLNNTKLSDVLNAKTILITGSSSGIGEQLAYSLAFTNAHLVLVARRGEKLAAIKQDIEKQGARVSIFPADLRNQEEMEGLLRFLHQLPEGLDIVVSNAGLSIRRPLINSLDRYHDFTRTMAINYLAPVQLLLSVIPLLKKKQGQIVNISAVNVLLPPVPYWAAYQASKSAFDVWFGSAVPELNAMGIATTSVYLPLVKTPMILPTSSYQNLPAMCPRHVAKIISKSFYTKGRRYKPWWLVFVQIAAVLFRGAWQRSALDYFKGEK